MHGPKENHHNNENSPVCIVSRNCLRKICEVSFDER